MKISLKISIIAFALIIASSQIFAQDTYNLKYKFEKGKTYFYRSNTGLETVQNMMGQEMTINNQSKTKLRLEIADVTANGFEIISSVDSLYSKTSNPTGGEDVINNGDGVVGKKSKLIFNNLGKKIKKVEIDAIQAQGGMDGAGGGFAFTQMTDKSLKIGEVWTVASVDTNKVGAEGSIISKSDTECKIEAKEKFNGVDCLKIVFKTTLKMEGSMAQGGMDIVLEGTGKTTGIIYYDYAKGLMLSTDSSTDTNMTAAIPSQSMTIPITQKIKTNVLLLEK